MRPLPAASASRRGWVVTQGLDDTGVDLSRTFQPSPRRHKTGQPLGGKLAGAEKQARSQPFAPDRLLDLVADPRSDNWSDGGATDLDKLAPTCQFHNRDRYRQPERYRLYRAGKDRWAFAYLGPRPTTHN
ncbi:hypothetical protein [Microtetraspora niveoalba]|uniref:hypothetical protein n=1 Tax=Microtetraspora niveoalba TaxID=46175 RepID=UPI000ACFE157|nr:hypothetical protein [Microtetraspora niveoalba]